MTRTLCCSATLAATLLAFLPGCGGNGKETSAPAPAATATTTTAAAAPGVTTTTAAGAAAEDDEAAPLLAWADATPEEGKAPLTVEFKADVEGGTPPLKYVWNFNDGTPESNEANPKHTFEKPGKYRADLNVTDAGGDEDADYIDIEVQ
jgi:PKD repeat protein